jgi:cell division protein FtsQ
MKDYIFPEQVNEDLSQPPKRKRIVHEFPVLIRYFFLVCSIFLFLKLGFHLPTFLSSPPDTLTIKGNHILSEEVIKQYLKLDEERSWFRLDPYQLSVQLRRHPWIEKALVHRSPPLTLNVNITERVPIAFLKTSDKLYLLGNDYLVLKRLQLSESWDLPIIVNRSIKNITPGDKLQPKELKRAFQLVTLLKEEKTLPLDAVSEIIITDPFNIVLISSPDGIRIKFGFENFRKKLAALSRLMPLITTNRKRIVYIDLRTIRGAVIKYKSP